MKVCTVRSKCMLWKYIAIVIPGTFVLFVGNEDQKTVLKLLFTSFMSGTEEGCFWICYSDN